MPKMLMDYGHGGNDSGAISNGFKEKDFNLSIGKRVKYHLERHNFQVIESREGDINPSLKERSDKANANNVDITVSLHCNSFSEEKKQGFEIYYYEGSARGKQLAQSILNSVIDEKLYTKNRGLKTNNLHMTRETKSISVLVEMGFISNNEDREILINKSEEMAIAITKGILKYYSTVYRKEEKEEKIYRVQVGAFKYKQNAETLLNKLKEEGYNAIIV